MERHKEYVKQSFVVVLLEWAVLGLVEFFFTLPAWSGAGSWLMNVSHTLLNRVSKQRGVVVLPNCLNKSIMGVECAMLTATTQTT